MMQNIFIAVEKQYKKNFNKLGDRKFHFVSRLFLWTKDEFAIEKLKNLKKEYIGSNEKEYARKIEDILNNEETSKKILFRKIREPFFLKYPLLKKYNKILFLNLFCKIIYGFELRKIIEKYIPNEEFIDLKNLLKNDKEAIAALSTHAVNYFYILDFYLDTRESIVSPKFFLDIAKDKKLFKDLPSIKIYLLTHCIIGETAFYSRGVVRNRNIYLQMLALAEKEIIEQYENVSLDNKFEFLVCAKLCGTKTSLSKHILEEAITCFDTKKQYFIEIKKANNDKTTLASAEHRNVLALMAMNSDLNYNKLKNSYF